MTWARALPLGNPERLSILYPSEYTFRVPSALELTPEKFHDFLSLASSPSLVEPGSARQSQPLGTEKIGTSPSPLGKENVASTPSPPSFAQVKI